MPRYLDTWSQPSSPYSQRGTSVQQIGASVWVGQWHQHPYIVDPYWIGGYQFFYPIMFQQEHIHKLANQNLPMQVCFIFQGARWSKSISPILRNQSRLMLFWCRPPAPAPNKDAAGPFISWPWNSNSCAVWWDHLHKNAIGQNVIWNYMYNIFHEIYVYIHIHTLKKKKKHESMHEGFGGFLI